MCIAITLRQSNGPTHELTSIFPFPVIFRHFPFINLTDKYTDTLLLPNRQLNNYRFSHDYCVYIEKDRQLFSLSFQINLQPLNYFSSDEIHTLKKFIRVYCFQFCLKSLVITNFVFLLCLR